jgi:hypothetical protein
MKVTSIDAESGPSLRTELEVDNRDRRDELTMVPKRLRERRTALRTF